MKLEEQRLCKCCGTPLSEKAWKHAVYIMGHSPRSPLIGARGVPIAPEVVERRVAKLRGRPRVGDGVARGPQHAKAVSGALRSPDNVVYRYHNLTHFIRTHPHLFAPEDVAWWGPCDRSCRAKFGLSSLRTQKNPRPAWKGWTVADIPEQTPDPQLP